MKKLKRQYVYITGYWNDNKNPIENYKCIIGEDKSFEDDDDIEIFFYFETIKDLKCYMKVKKAKDIIPGNGNEFTITSYELGKKF